MVRGRLLSVAVVAALAAALASSGAPAVAATSSSAAGSRLPLTFDQAKAQGKNVDWGPQCDTSTGKVAVPSGYAPPCVEPWKGGDNGGATAPGVTADTIRVALYQTQPDLLQQTFFENTGSDESLAKERDTVQAYVDYFSAHYQLYGRKVELVTVKASGAPDDEVAAKADAIRVATEVKAFASFGGPAQTDAYAEELAARGVLCVGDCLIAEPQQFLVQHAPYLWPTLASPEQASEHWAAFVGKQLAGGRAVHAGDSKLQKKQRVFGVVHYDDDAGTFRKSVQTFEKLLRGYGVKTATTVPYTLDLSTAQEDARLVITKLQTAGVTSVLLAADPVFPTFLTKEATTQGYFPEWIVLGYAFTDTAVFGRQYDQRQWAHAFGVSLLPARTADDVDEFATILQWQTGQPPEAKTFRELVQAPLIFFTGVHLAGPHLTAKTFAAGLDRYPAETPTVPTRLHLSWGRHHIWKGLDVTGSDDATVIWWDPNATGPDEVGHDGKGLYRYADGGRRYLPGSWPKKPVGLYDDATSLTVLTSLPPADAPPSYPRP
ncbi:MAG TPA: ABC transporter substrate-binding protein [Acidimicrobiia bacterium]